MNQGESTGRRSVAVMIGICFLLSACDNKQPVIPRGTPLLTLKYLNTNDEIIISDQEYISFEIQERPGVIIDVQDGPRLGCSMYPEALDISRRRSTYVGNWEAIWPRVRERINQLIANDMIGPVSFAVMPGTFQRITTEENWKIYPARVYAYHIRKGSTVPVASIEANFEFSVLTGWTPTAHDCHDQGSG